MDYNIVLFPFPNYHNKKTKLINAEAPKGTLNSKQLLPMVVIVRGPFVLVDLPATGVHQVVPVVQHVLLPLLLQVGYFTDGASVLLRQQLFGYVVEEGLRVGGVEMDL